MQVVISQSMYFPWVGFLEQLRLADAFVLYDDVQFSKGSFTNRVQIKTAAGPRWLTVPLSGLHLGQRIDEVQLDDRRDWRGQQRDQLAQAYRKAPFAAEMLGLVDAVFAQPTATLSQLAHASTLALIDYFGLAAHLGQYDAADMGIDGRSSQRVLDIVRHLRATAYITGHGASNYLDHQAFEQAGIAVRYMDYRCMRYPQLHGEFTPYVSALDLVANCGREGARYIQSTTIEWKEFINEPV
jgi:hypothetical protein